MQPIFYAICKFCYAPCYTHTCVASIFLQFSFWGRKKIFSKLQIEFWQKKIDCITQVQQHTHKWVMKIVVGVFFILWNWELLIYQSASNTLYDSKAWLSGCQSLWPWSLSLCKNKMYRAASERIHEIFCLVNEGISFVIAFWFYDGW